uniref:C2 domain-containing protein n=1 Tax=Macrostomum lignano TaxID=282301 RepID=A0A1I8G705_9PLAT
MLPMHYLLTGTNLQLTDDIPVYEAPAGVTNKHQQFPNQLEHQQRKLVGHLRVSLQLGSDTVALGPLLEQEQQRVASDRAAASKQQEPQPLLAQGQGESAGLSDGKPPPPPPPPPPLPPAPLSQPTASAAAPSEPVEQPTALFALLQIVEARGVAYSSVATTTGTNNHNGSAASQQLHLTGGTTATSAGGRSSARDHCSRNLYCAVRLFWQSDRFHTEVVWGSSDPKFRFSQISPVLYNAALLERLRQNYAIVEVWDKKTSYQRDSLVGTVKLPLHQFYLAYKDPAVAAAMLRSQYPVVGADGWLPIRDPFHEAQPGSDFGQLRVLLAMGSGAQIAHLQRLRSDGGNGIDAGLLPYHVPFDSVTAAGATASGSTTGGQARELEEVTEHCFEVCIDSLEDLRLPEDCSYGEVDCFIQYYFPALDPAARPGSSPMLCLKPYRSSTTIAIPHPSFHDLTRHRLQLPVDAPFQRELVALAGAQGGLPCELWLRAYSPNLRDQCIARALLPLGRLCALVAMSGVSNGAGSLPSASTSAHTGAPASTQRLALPLAGIDEAGACGATAYLSVAYRSTGVRVSRSSESAGSGVDSYPRGQTAVLGVSLLRAAGLEAAAKACQRAEAPAGLMAASLGHAVAGGVNAFARYWLSFDPSGQRLTRCVARSHCPDFQQHSDYAMPLHWPGGISLAELIEEGGLEIELWHQVPTPARHLTVGTGPEPLVTAPGQPVPINGGAGASCPEILLGRLRLPLGPLLTCKSGLRGWYPLLAPAKTTNASAATTETVDAEDLSTTAQFVGAVELEIRFGSAEDRARVLESGRELGFAPQDLEDLEERWESIEAPEFRRICVQVIDAEFPLRLALRAGQDRLPISSRLYCRYRLYTRRSVQSPKYCVPPHDEHGSLSVSFSYKRVFAFRTSLALLQYLREERLEIQLWISYSSSSGEGHDDVGAGASARDLLIGTCWMPLRDLAIRRRAFAGSPGRYALVKPGVRCFDGACLRLKATLTDSDEPPSEPEDSVDEEEAVAAAVADAGVDDSEDVGGGVGSQRRQRHQQVTRRQRLAHQHTVPLRVAIEEAKRLCPVPDAATGEERLPPSAYVTVQPADRSKPLATDVKAATNNPAWGFVAEARFDKSLFAYPDRGCLLTFKVWHSYGDAVENDRLIGTASVDLSPLLFGFKQVLGWYDVQDYRERCRGHLYVGITPLEPLTGLAKQSTAPILASTASTGSFSDIGRRQATTAPIGSAIVIDDGAAAAADGGTSRSMLHRSLQHQMAELDNLTTRLRRRLLNPNADNGDDDSHVDDSGGASVGSNNSAPLVRSPPLPPAPPPPAARVQASVTNSGGDGGNSSSNPYGLDFDIR